MLNGILKPRISLGGLPPCFSSCPPFLESAVGPVHDMGARTINGMHYKAPELLFKKGTVDQINPAWDCWALGVVFAYATLGRHPYWKEVGGKPSAAEVCNMMVSGCDKLTKKKKFDLSIDKFENLSNSLFAN